VDESATELRGSLAGAVLTRADAGYDAARRGFNALVDRRPAVIARCLGLDDVAAAFDFAPARGLEVAVPGGGHNPAGHCVCDGGLVIDLSLMRRVEVNGDAGTARAEGGARWLEFDSATQSAGLVTPGGAVVHADPAPKSEHSAALAVISYRVVQRNEIYALIWTAGCGHVREGV
jgi:FAD/FMN-containing dehydrogenase